MPASLSKPVFFSVLALFFNFAIACSNLEAAQENKEIRSLGEQSCSLRSREADSFFSAYQKELNEAGTSLCAKKYNEAASQIKSLIETEKKKEAPSKRALSILQYWLADCYYLQSRYTEARKEYILSLEQIPNDKLEPKEKALRLACLRGLLATSHRLNDPDTAAYYSDEAMTLTKEIFGGGNVNYGWSLMHRSENLSRLGKIKESEEAFRHAIYLFRKCNMDRIMQEEGIKDAYKAESDVEKEEKRKRIWRLVFGTTNEKAMPEDLAENVVDPVVRFCDGEYGLPESINVHKEAPGYVWVNPRRDAAAILVCVHGLGLHHRNFDSFAKEMVKQGIVVIAFDVRGFGSYLSSQGQEKLDLKNCVSDLKHVVDEIRDDYRDKPLFMLGESMGGAIALRFAALSPGTVDGIICSVPAGKRYKAGTTALTVALHYVTEPNRPFAIGNKVVEQSTSKEQDRERWKNDPSSRLELTPKELLEFQKFMNENSSYAKKINHTPVLLFQGDEDRLVKKSGTYDLFEALGTKSKTLVIIGGAEHLIFEAPVFKDDITSGVVGWMESHGALCELPDQKESSPKEKERR